MGTVTKSFTFSAGGTVLSAEHNTNYDTLYTLVNGNIENVNIGASAAIVDTKLAQITTAGKVSAAAVTSLSSLPAGAGSIPDANLGNALLAGNSPVTGDILTYNGSAPTWENGESYIYFWDDFETLGGDSAGVLRAVTSKYAYNMRGALGSGGQTTNGIIRVDGTNSVGQEPLLFQSDGSGSALTDFGHCFTAASNPKVWLRFKKLGAGNISFYLGLVVDASAPDKVEPTDGIYVHWTNTGNIFVKANGTGGSTDRDSGVAIGTGWHTVVITITSTTVDATVDGTSITQITSNIVSSAMGLVAVGDNETSSRGIDLDYWGVRQVRA